MHTSCIGRWSTVKVKWFCSFFVGIIMKYGDVENCEYIAHFFLVFVGILMRP